MVVATSTEAAALVAAVVAVVLPVQSIVHGDICDPTCPHLSDKPGDGHINVLSSMPQDQSRSRSLVKSPFYFL